ncbi:MAG: PilC/PilY family type IV pilus protein [Granulosicoccus sp.]
MDSNVTRSIARQFCLAAAIATTICLPALADDTDVYKTSKKPNFLFVLDYSRSMQWGVQGEFSPLPARIDILKDSVNRVLALFSGQINAGLGSLYSSIPSGVRWPVSDLEADANTIDPAIPAGRFTVREIISRQLDRTDAIGATATVNALVDAARYFRGGSVTHLDQIPGDLGYYQPDVWDPTNDRYSGGSKFAAMPSSYSPGNAFYISPAQQCQANNIVLISDGVPTVLQDNDSLKAIIGSDASGCEDLSTTIFGSITETTYHGNCAPEIARTLATTELIPGDAKSVVKTYTIGFSINGVGKTYLERIATEGQGRYFQANNPTQLDNALAELLTDAGYDGEGFTELAIDIDRASFSHDNHAYFSLFTPTDSNRWNGNLKGYFVDSTGLVDIKGDPAVINGTSGLQFADNAQSFWSPTEDGNAVAAGGASAKMESGPRKLYTYLGSNIPANGVNLAAATVHQLKASNNSISTAMMGLPNGSVLRDKSLTWIQTASMGDPLHSKSVSINYDGRKVVYVMTNQGLLHAIDATTPLDPNAGSPDISGGTELFAFMPKRLLSHLPEMVYQTLGDHIYGLDGAITRWHDDINNDGIVNGSDSVMLVFGMRRGGDAYYALDVTNPVAPKLKWSIDSNTAGFENLAQSWSRMSLINVNRGGNEERVLVFGGGYDAANLDNVTARTESSGNALFMVDANGHKIWSASKSGADKIVVDMKYSIASDLSVIDSDADGMADRLYVGDMGGQVWRVDFNDVNLSSQFKVTRFADLENGNHQRFFYAPSVALNNTAQGEFLSVSIGSGDRTDPMNKSSDNAFYMMRDVDLAKGAPVSGFSTIGASNLYDTTANEIASTNATVKQAATDALDAARGWRIDLNAGEKALSRLVTFEGKLLATTFQPDDSSSDPCKPANYTRLYMMDVTSAAPVKYAEDGSKNETDNSNIRTRRLNNAGIPSSPVIVFPDGSGSVQVIVDKESVNLIDQQLSRVFWHSK